METIIAREHLRVSRDKSGKQRSITEQHDDNQRAAVGHGWTLGEPYNDGAVSAYRKSTKSREGFDALIKDLETKEFAADVLLIWQNDRNTRSAEEGIRLINRAEEAGVKIYVTAHNRLYDPAEARDRRSLQEDYVDGEYDNAKRSRAIKRAVDADAVAGRPYGGRHTPFGYVRVGERASMRWEVEPEQARVLRSVIDAVISGRSLRSEVLRLNDASVPTATGARWDVRGLKRVISNPAIAGRRQFHGEVIGDGQWPAIIDQQKWEALAATFDPDKRPNHGRSVLAGLIRCGRCGELMTSAGEVYRCNNRTGCGNVKISKQPVERWVLNQVAKHWQAIERQRATSADDQPDPRVAEVSAEIERLERKLTELGDAYDSDVITGPDYFPKLAAYRDRITKLEKERGAILREQEQVSSSKPADGELRPQLAEFVALATEHGVDPATVTYQPSDEQLRAFIGRYVDQVTVKPDEHAKAGRRKSDPGKRVEILWRD